MVSLTPDYILRHVADSRAIFERGRRIFQHGAFLCSEADPEKGCFTYEVDGNYGDYTTRIEISDDLIKTSCDCPYPGVGCKHTVAVLLDVHNRLIGWKKLKPAVIQENDLQEPYLTEEEIRRQAIEDRNKRAASEPMTFFPGDMVKGEHTVQTSKGKTYTVTLHDPKTGRGHCTCPDFLTNRLNTCKHMIFAINTIKKAKDLTRRIETERFPFVDIYWDSENDGPRLFCERTNSELSDISPILFQYFNQDGVYIRDTVGDLVRLFALLDGNKCIRIQPFVIKRLDEYLLKRQLLDMAQAGFPPVDILKTPLYPYQKDGVRFGLYRKAVLIGDEMGLGKTLQAIALAILKKEHFGFHKALVITLASLKEQWKREIERFSDEKGVIVSGSRSKRQEAYAAKDCLFKITNYEAVIRDEAIIAQFDPDVVILDEAQRIKNFNTKTADSVKSLPRKHAMVLTGTPLENKLEDVYSIIQFLDPDMLSPLWKFAADYFMLSRNKKGKIIGYRNLDKLHERLKTIVIRRKKEEVLDDLPDEVVNTYYLEMTDAQMKLHNGFLQCLLPILNKKYLTPMDLRRIQELLLLMRRSCDSTYLIDRTTNISPKLAELEGIIEELVIQNNRKVVLFSEWTAMTFLIAKQLSACGIPFVELTGKIPVHKRQLLIDEFTTNPKCKVFLSTDAGGSGLNLQAADCVINFELPWNPAKMNQRIGRVSRIGQKSQCVNVVNLVMKNSIEEKILAGIQLKTDLFMGVFDGTTDMVEFSQEKRFEVLNKLREMLGEEQAPVPKDTPPPVEIPEDTPHFLNPEVLRETDKKNEIPYEAEETPPDDSEPVSDQMTAETEENDRTGEMSILSGQSPEKIETVLNSGMQFISGLLEMATGRKIETTGSDDKLIRIDKQTGEVTLKFKLPGFA